MLLFAYSSVPSGYPQISWRESDGIILLEWSPLALEDRNGIIITYQVQVGPAKATQPAAVWTVPVTDEESSQQFLLDDLQAATDYFAAVSAQTEVGSGPYSQKVLFTTPEQGTTQSALQCLIHTTIVLF